MIQGKVKIQSARVLIEIGEAFESFPDLLEWFRSCDLSKVPDVDPSDAPFTVQCIHHSTLTSEAAVAVDLVIHQSTVDTLAAAWPDMPPTNEVLDVLFGGPEA